jgi:integrase
VPKGRRQDGKIDASLSPGLRCTGGGIAVSREPVCVVAEGTTSGKKMHGARYTAGTEFYLATSDIYATQQLLGHADVNTTANIYVQGSPADLEQKLGQVWGE